MLTPLAVPIFMLFLSLTVWADREATDRKAISVVSKIALIFFIFIP